MIESIGEMHLSNDYTITGPSLFWPPMLESSWIDGIMELRIGGDTDAPVLLIGLFWW